MNAIAYCRISVADQSTNSIPGQITDIENYCKKNSLELVRTFIENGQSAFNFNRKEWQELESFVRINKDIKYLVIASMDRFSRANIADSLKKMEEIQERTGVKILTVTDPINLDTSDFGVELKRIIELLFANYELKKIRQRTSRALYDLVSKGYFPNNAPYGYINQRDGDGQPTLIIDEEKAFFVRIMFRSYIQGMNIEEIRKHLSTHGCRIKGNSTIKRILANPAYASIVQVPKKADQPAYQVKGKHPPIISETDYWLIQERLHEKRYVSHKNEEVYLRGVLRCYECGRLLTAGKSTGKTKKYWYYFCKTHRKNFPAKKVHSWFESILDNLSFPEESIQNIKASLKEKVNEHITTRVGDLMKTNIKLAKVTSMITSVEEKYLTTPDISETTYRKKITELRADESRLRQQAASLNVTSSYLHSLVDEAVPKLTDLKSSFLRFEISRQHLLINTLFNYSLTFDGKIGRTRFLYPLFAHNELALKEKGLLEIRQSLDDLGEIPRRSVSGNSFEPLLSILALTA